MTMIKLFTGREIISLILILLFGRLGFWIGASQGDTGLIKSLAAVLFGLALLLAVAVALARRSQVLAKRSASMWFDEREDDEDEW